MQSWGHSPALENESGPTSQGCPEKTETLCVCHPTHQNEPFPTVLTSHDILPNMGSRLFFLTLSSSHPDPECSWRTVLAIPAFYCFIGNPEKVLSPYQWVRICYYCPENILEISSLSFLIIDLLFKSHLNYLKRMVLLYNPGWSWTHNLLELASGEVELQVCATKPNLTISNPNHTSHHFN